MSDDVELLRFVVEVEVAVSVCCGHGLRPGLVMMSDRSERGIHPGAPSTATGIGGAASA